MQCLIVTAKDGEYCNLKTYLPKSFSIFPDLLIIISLFAVGVLNSVCCFCM